MTYLEFDLACKGYLSAQGFDENKKTGRNEFLDIIGM